MDKSAELNYDRRTIVIGLPFGGRDVCPQWAVKLSTYQFPMNTSRNIISSYGLETSDARNRIVEQAILAKAKYLMFIDDDVAAPPGGILKLVYNLAQDSKAMVTGGIYFMKGEITEPVVFQKKGEGPFWQWKKGEVFECDIIGTGFMLINMEVFNHIEKPYFKIIDEFDGHRRTVGTEDAYFCDKVRAAGFKILADGGILCDHYDMDSKKVYRIPEDSYPMKHPVEDIVEL
jgi:hypothetical protein